MKAPALLFLLALIAAPVAVAQSPAGAWDFKTDEMRDACTISGQMTIAPTKGKSQFTCSFKAVQSCTNGFLKTIHTEQSCSATMSGKQVTIISRLDKVTSVDPPAQMEGVKRRYQPDNFTVTINPHGDEMDGIFESMGTAPVKFRRQQDLTS